MSFEIALNALWVCLGAVALGLLGWSELADRSFRGRAGQWRRVLSVLLAVIFLFPCVSASDDLITIHDFQFTLETRGEVGNPLTHRSGDEKPVNLHLARLFESLQQFQVLGLYLLLPTFCCLGTILSLHRLATERYLLCLSGRAPPLSPLS